MKFLEPSRPRELRPSSSVVWYIQTDASFESSDDSTFAGIGAVLFDPSGKPVKFFSKGVDLEFDSCFEPSWQKVCEFFALFCAGRDPSGAVVTYTDNNAVRDALIAGHTANSLARKILIATLGLESELQLTPWY